MNVYGGVHVCILHARVSVWDAHEFTHMHAYKANLVCFMPHDVRFDFGPRSTYRSPRVEYCRDRVAQVLEKNFLRAISKISSEALTRLRSGGTRAEMRLRP